MSALARYFHMSGHQVSGYDRERTVLTEKLEALGIGILYQFDEDSMDKEIDCVVYTPAIKEDHQEFQYFESRNIEMKKNECFTRTFATVQFLWSDSFCRRGHE